MEAGSIANQDVVMETTDLLDLTRNLSRLPIEIVEIICLYAAQNSLQFALTVCFARLCKPQICLGFWKEELAVLELPLRKGYTITIDHYEEDPFAGNGLKTIRIEGKDPEGKLAYRALIKDHPEPYTYDLLMLSDNHIPKGIALHDVHSVTLLDGTTGYGVYYRACGSSDLEELTFLDAGSSSLRYLHECNLAVSTVFFFINEDAPKKRNRFAKAVKDHSQPLPGWLQIGLSPLSKTIKKVYFVSVKPHEDEDEELFWISRRKRKQISGSGRWHSWNAIGTYYTFYCPKWYDNFDRVEYAKAQIKEREEGE